MFDPGQYIGFHEDGEGDPGTHHRGSSEVDIDSRGFFSVSPSDKPVRQRWVSQASMPIKSGPSEGHRGRKDKGSEAAANEAPRPSGAVDRDAA